MPVNVDNAAVPVAPLAVVSNPWRLSAELTRYFAITAVFVLLCFARSGMAADNASSVSLTLAPNKIEMGTFYNGARLQMEGSLPSGANAIVILRGPSGDELFNKKGRVGPIWINTDKVHVSGAPSLFLRFSSHDVHTFLDRETIDRYELDELSVRKRIHIRTNQGEPDPQYRETIVNSYLELKKKDGSYRRVADRVHITEDNASGARYQFSFTWPKTAPPGSYQVEVYACRDGQVIGSSSTALPVGRARFPASIAALAHDHALLYGIMAVLVAVVVGFGVKLLADLVTKPRRELPKKTAPAPEPRPATFAAAASGDKANDPKS